MNQTTAEVLIRFENLTKKFGNLVAVDHINLEIHRGEVVGFLGPNGAGKSTTMKMLAHLIRPTKGNIYIRDAGQLYKLTDQNKEILLSNIGFLIENPAFYKTATPRQLLTYFAKLKGYPRNLVKKRVEEVIKLVGLQNWIDKKLETFSKGMRQKIGVISAIVHDPDIIILDEPHTGLDPEARRELRDFILFLKEKGKTIFLSSHLLYEVSEVADRVAIISQGKIIVCDTLENLEQEAKDSVIEVEVLPMDKQPTQIIEMLQKIVHPINQMQDIWYQPDGQKYKIRFNGNPNIQNAILKALIQNNIPVIEFSVPKAGLLEAMYLKFVNKSSKQQLEAKKQTIEVESIL